MLRLLFPEVVMDKTQKVVRLSSSELEYMKGARFLQPSLMQILDTVTEDGSEARLLYVSRFIAEEFRTAFTIRLAAAGFDSDYEPNCEGRMLEALIDRFHLQ